MRALIIDMPFAFRADVRPTGSRKTTTAYFRDYVPVYVDQVAKSDVTLAYSASIEKRHASLKGGAREGGEAHEFIAHKGRFYKRAVMLEQNVTAATLIESSARSKQVTYQAFNYRKDIHLFGAYNVKTFDQDVGMVDPAFCSLIPSSDAAKIDAPTRDQRANEAALGCADTFLAVDGDLWESFHPSEPFIELKFSHWNETRDRVRATVSQRMNANRNKYQFNAADADQANEMAATLAPEFHPHVTVKHFDQAAFTSSAYDIACKCILNRALYPSIPTIHYEPFRLFKEKKSAYDKDDMVGILSICRAMIDYKIPEALKDDVMYLYSIGSMFRLNAIRDYIDILSRRDVDLDNAVTERLREMHSDTSLDLQQLDM